MTKWLVLGQEKNNQKWPGNFFHWERIYGNRTFKLTIHLNISHDYYCIFDGTLCVAAYKNRLDLLFMEPTSGEDNNSQVFSKKGLKFLI